MRITDLVAALLTVAATNPVPAETLAQAEAAAADLAAHIDIGTAGVAWWVAVCAGVSRDPEPVNVASLAREASVIPARVHAGALDESEAARIGDAIDAERAVVLTPLMRTLLERAETDVRQHRAAMRAVQLTHGDATSLRGTLAAIEARRDIFARAAQPVTVAPARLDRSMPPPVGRIEGEYLASADTRAVSTTRRFLVCGGCAYRWQARTDHPKRCPRCQAGLRWPDESIPAQPTEQPASAV